MSDLSQLMKQAQQMQAKLMEAQRRMAEMEFVGTSGGGMVTIVLNGKGDIKRLDIDPKLMIPEEADVVSDLIVAAYKKAKMKSEEAATDNMGSILPPGVKLPF